MVTADDAPCFAHLPDGSIVLVATITASTGTARVCNEDGEWWDEPVARLSPTEEGVTW